MTTEHAAYSKKGVLIAGLLLAMLFGALNATIVGTAMPRIVGELGGLHLMTWLTTAYMLVATAIVPIAGKLADLLGRRVVYVTGLLVFIAGSALCGAAQTIHQLIAFRAVQGLGGGIMMPMALIIIGDLFSGKERARWQGVFGGMFGLASVIGPQLGGWIVDAWSWRGVFYINSPLGLLAMALIAIGLGPHKKSERPKFDIAGMLTMTVGVVSLLLALTLGGKEYEWESWQIIGLFALSAVFLALFVVAENRAADPVLPIRLFRSKTFSVVNAIGFLMSVGMFGSIMFVPFFLQGVVGISPSASGTAMTPMMLALLVASVVGGQLVQKIGVRAQMALGMAVSAAGFALLATMDESTTLWTATVHMIVLGFGVGLVMPLLTLALQESFPKTELGVVTASSQFFRQIGGVFGMTVLGAVMNHQSSVDLSEKLGPVLQKLPPSPLVDEVAKKIAEEPQDLYGVLLSPEALAKIPEAMARTFVPILKSAMVDALHHVFWWGFAFVVLGALLTGFVGNIRLSDRRGEKRADVGAAVPAGNE